MLVLLNLLLPSRVYTPDLKALRQLYELLDGEQWTNNRGWIVHPCGEDTTYCNDWELAKCEADSTHCLPWHLDPCNDEAISWYGVACVDPCNEVWDGGSCKAGRITQVSLGDNNVARGERDAERVDHAIGRRVVGRRDDALRRREERGGAAGEKHDQKEAGHFVESGAARAVLRRV